MTAAGVPVIRSAPLMPNIVAAFPLQGGVNSKAPMSLAAPCGLAMPLWSVAGATLSSPASMAGLPAPSAWVWVGPVLSFSGPRSGSTFTRSPAAGT